MNSYFDLTVFDTIEEKRNLKHSAYELIESEDESANIQNPFLQERNPLFENDSSFENINILSKKSETKNIEPIKQTKKSEKKGKGKTSLLNKKRGSTGRKKKLNLIISQDNNIKAKKPYHDRNRTDNLIRKIQVHYISFIRSFINEITKYLKLDEQFLKIAYKIKNDVHKNKLKEIKQKTLGDIISSEISSKYLKNDKSHNKSIVKDLSKNELLKSILSQNYLTFFRKVYYKSNKRINLKQFGSEDKEINLSDNVEMFKDFLKKKDFDSSHILKLNKCVAKYFYPKLIFLVNYN